MSAAHSTADAGRTERDEILRDQWSVLVEKDDRTSPEEYPDHCLITMEEVGGIIDATLEASAAHSLFECAEILEKAEEAHANCDECEGEGVPELCEKCFPLFDDARVKRRAALAAAKGVQ